MSKDLPEELSEHVSVVTADKPPELPHCADVDFESAFPDGFSVRIRARLPWKPSGNPTTVPLLSDEDAIVSPAMNPLRRTLCKPDRAG